MSKDEKIELLEAEILAARKTIMALTRAIEELSKNVGKQTTIINPSYPYVYPYRYHGPYWTYTVGDITYTSSVGHGNINTSKGLTTNTYYVGHNTIGDDDEGDSGVRAAV